MKQARTQPFLFAFLTLPLIASLPVACDEEQPVPVPPETITISGRVMKMPVQTPLSGATVQLIANDVDITDPNYLRRCQCAEDLCSFRTTSRYDEEQQTEGWWILEDVPVRYNPETLTAYDLLIEVSNEGFPPGYNIFTLSLGDQSDLTILAPFFRALFALTSGASLADLIENQLAVFLGVAIGFAETDYPPDYEFISGVVVSAEGGDPPEKIPITYFLGEGKTSDLGIYYFTVLDANEHSVPSVKVSGTKPGVSLVGGYYPACPGSVGSAALIDPYYRP